MGISYVTGGVVGRTPGKKERVVEDEDDDGCEVEGKKLFRLKELPVLGADVLDEGALVLMEKFEVLVSRGVEKLPPVDGADGFAGVMDLVDGAEGLDDVMDFETEGAFTEGAFTDGALTAA